jgi:hypothetical protein
VGVILVLIALYALVVGIFKNIPITKSRESTGCTGPLGIISVVVITLSVLVNAVCYPFSRNPSDKWYIGIFVTMYVFWVLAFLMRQIEKGLRSESPELWKGTRVIFLRLAIPIIVCSFLVGFLCVKPGVETSVDSLFLTKTPDKVNPDQPVQGKIVYVLDKFVLFWKPANGQVREFITSVNVDDITQIIPDF